MPRTFRLHKLVRDNIVELNIAQGGEVEHKVLKGDELRRALLMKIIEETMELGGEDVSVEELADIQEIIDQLAENAGISQEDIKVAQTEKNSKNGAFKNGHFIETLSLPDDNEWVAYYAKDPEKFPEIK